MQSLKAGHLATLSRLQRTCAHEYATRAIEWANSQARDGEVSGTARGGLYAYLHLVLYGLHIVADKGRYDELLVNTALLVQFNPDLGPRARVLNWEIFY